MSELLGKREIIAKVREHFSQPGVEFGYDSVESSCVYRGDGDRTSSVRCAFGVIVPDKLYDPSFEGMVASDVMREDNRISDLFDGEIVSDIPALSDSNYSSTFIDALQELHDGAAVRGDSIAHFLRELDKFEQEQLG